MINTVTLLGRTGKEPEIRRLESGTAILSFSIATSRSYKDKSGEWKEQTEWHNVVVWGEAGERLQARIKKGSLLFVSGELRTDKYDKAGQVHYSTKVVANTVKVLDPKEKEAKDSNEDLPF